MESVRRLGVLHQESINGNTSTHTHATSNMAKYETPSHGMYFRTRRRRRRKNIYNIRWLSSAMLWESQFPLIELCAAFNFNTNDAAVIPLFHIYLCAELIYQQRRWATRCSASSSRVLFITNSSASLRSASNFNFLPPPATPATHRPQTFMFTRWSISNYLILFTFTNRALQLGM